MSRFSPEYLTNRESNTNMSLTFLKKAIEDRAILESVVAKCDNDLTLTMNLGKNIIGEIEFNELEYNFNNKETKEVAATSKVGKHIKYIPISVDKRDDIYVVKCSRKEAQKECFDNYISKLIPGDIIDARIVKINNYGTFCDIGCGIIALLPTNYISVTHIIEPIKMLRQTSRLKVVVKNIDEDYKIQLSHKELLGTWEEEASKFNEEDIVCGTVLSVEDYGVFVRISQNLSGLAEIPNIEVKPGDTVSVKITNIKPFNMKVKLVILEKCEQTEQQTKFNYYIDSGHIKQWNYSTETAKKQIRTEFN